MAPINICRSVRWGMQRPACDHTLKMEDESQTRATCEKCGELYESAVDDDGFRAWHPVYDRNAKTAGAV